MKIFKSILAFSLSGKTEKRFALAVILGLGFSMAVILGTIGIMDGFEFELTKKLREINSDVQLIPRQGFIERAKIESTLSKSSLIRKYQLFLQLEAFAIKEEAAKGILIKTDNSLPYQVNAKPEVIIGKELAKVLKLQKGDFFTLALSTGEGAFEGLPNLYQVSVAEISDFGIFEKNLRIIRAPLAWVENVMKASSQTNLIQLELDETLSNRSDFSLKVRELENYLRQEHPSVFHVRPYWNEFKTLLEAVEIEKFAISMILQIIVVISIFNTMAFIFYLKSKKNQEIFLLQALGLTQRSLMMSWTGLLLLLWLAGGLVAILFTQAFDFILYNSNLIQLPGDIYHLGKIKLMLDWNDYMMVFMGALVWMLIFDYILWLQVSKKSILSGLRKEFG